MPTHAVPEPARPATKAAGNAVETLAGLVREDLTAVDAVIHDRMASPVGMIPNLAAYALNLVWMMWLVAAAWRMSDSEASSPGRISPAICIFTSPFGAEAAISNARTLSSKSNVRVIRGFTSIVPDDSIDTQRGNT